jgi:isoleucyl-tRNA synthetase
MANDYKETIHLPTTEFPMKANLANREPQMLTHWQESQLYQQIRHARAGAEKFILHDGPPYANGNIHLGHAINKILKDIIIKSKSMSGFDAPYVPGWDCHGLPIELNVEKKIGKCGQKVDAATFRQACRDYASSQIALQKESFQRLGVFGEWGKPYETMNFHYEANIVRSLSQVIANGYLHRGFKPVYWCLDCQSALAEAEVEYQDKTSDALYVAFEIIAADREKIFSLFEQTDKEHPLPIYLPIWTTTPWTLPANEAVTLHPEAEYTLAKTPTAYFLIAKDRLHACSEKFLAEATAYDLSKSGKDFEHIELQHPFLSKQVPIIVGNHVTMDAGTGAVHTAPAHGLDDFQIGLKYHLLVDNPVLASGCFRDDTPHVAGLYVSKANPVIIELLEKNNKLLHHEKIQHSYPHCWRHKTPLIFRATPQWFIRMDRATERNDDTTTDEHWAHEGGRPAKDATLREQMLAQIDQVEWLPDWGKARIQNMVTSSPDWCISRQRAWGVPITLFIHKNNGRLHPKTLELLEQVALRIEQKGADAWFDLTAEELLGTDAHDYDKVTDVLDVWFDSGVSHYAVLNSHEWPNLRFPADLYLEGSDQHRGWFQSSLKTSVAMQGAAPFKTVLTHGFAVDAQGRKMSKSIGNVIPPEKVVTTLGADILRLWVASTDYRSEMTVSDEILKRAADAYRRIRNTARYLLSNINDFDPEKHLVAGENFLALDAWIIEQTQCLQEKIRNHYDNYEFHLIYHDIHNFCVNQLGSLYLDVIKDRQYTGKKHGLARTSAQSAMYHVLNALVRWLAPILSFTAEEIWSYIPKHAAESIFLTTWYEDFPNAALLTEAQKNISAADWQLLLQLRTVVNKELEQARNQGLIGAGLEADILIYDPKEIFTAIANQLGGELKFFLITSKTHVSNSPIPENLTCHEMTLDQQIAPVAIAVTPIPETMKCLRCWHRNDSVGRDFIHPKLCIRCIGNAFGKGETRKFF